MNEPTESVGARLRRARESKSLSVQKAADELRLDAWAVEAIEADQYERVGPPVYAKGHLKRYAQLLGLPQAEVLTGYDALTDGTSVATAEAPLRVRTQAALASNLPGRQIAALCLMLLLVAGVLWWKPWQQRSAAESVDPAGSVADVPGGAAALGTETAAVAEVAPSSGSDPAGAASTPAADGATARTAAGNGATAASGGVTAVTAGIGHTRLRMSFSADSWVDVRDASGKQVYSGNGRANSVKTIVADAPLRIYLGYANGVQLEINNHAVAIAPSFVSGDVARFEAGADGVLRSYAGNTRPRG
jgi:cytoskeleton protein RodZ